MGTNLDGTSNGSSLAMALNFLGMRLGEDGSEWAALTWDELSIYRLAIR